MPVEDSGKCCNYFATGIGKDRNDICRLTVLIEANVSFCGNVLWKLREPGTGKQITTATAMNNIPACCIRAKLHDNLKANHNFIAAAGNIAGVVYRAILSIEKIRKNVIRIAALQAWS